MRSEKPARRNKGDGYAAGTDSACPRQQRGSISGMACPLCPQAAGHGRATPRDVVNPSTIPCMAGAETLDRR
jgi:hypothetical protein